MELFTVIVYTSRLKNVTINGTIQRVSVFSFQNSKQKILSKGEVIENEEKNSLICDR